MTDASTHDRLRSARNRVDDATRAARMARIAAAEPLRARAVRRTRRWRVGMTVAAAVVVVLVCAAAVFAVHDRSVAHRADVTATALGATRNGIVALLTTNPADPAGYVDRALDVTTGAQRDRLSAARAALAAEIAAEGASSAGQILSAGLVADPTSDNVGAHAEALVVAEAGDPRLVGGDPADRTVTLRVTVQRTVVGWRIARAVVA